MNGNHDGQKRFYPPPACPRGRQIRKWPDRCAMGVAETLDAAVQVERKGPARQIRAMFSRPSCELRQPDANHGPRGGAFCPLAFHRSPRCRPRGNPRIHAPDGRNGAGLWSGPPIETGGSDRAYRRQGTAADTERGKQIAPGRARAHAPEDGFYTRIARLSRKMRFKSPPYLIHHRKTVLVHSNLHSGSLNRKSAAMGILNVHRPWSVGAFDA